MKLDETESKILHAALLNGEATHPEIAERVGIPPYEVRRIIISLLEQGIISPYTLINQFALGWMKIGLFFSFHNVSPKDIDKTIMELGKYDKIVSIIELFGRHQYFISVNARSLPEFENFMTEVSTKLPSLKIDQSIAIRNSMTLFKRKYLCPEQKDTTALRYDHNSALVNLDDKSIAVLNSIIDRGGHPNGQTISEDTGMARQTVWNRIYDLQAVGVIVGYSYNLDPHKIGYIPYDLLIRTTTSSNDFKQKFYEYCASHPNVVGLTESIGSWQYEIRIEIKDLSDAARLAQELNRQFYGEINSVEMVAIGREIKYMKTPLIKTSAEPQPPKKKKAA